jgi:hypothetical protein
VWPCFRPPGLVGVAVGRFDLIVVNTLIPLAHPDCMHDLEHPHQDRLLGAQFIYSFKRSPTSFLYKPFRRFPIPADPQREGPKAWQILDKRVFKFIGCHSRLASISFNSQYHLR